LAHSAPKYNHKLYKAFTLHALCCASLAVWDGFKRGTGLPISKLLGLDAPVEKQAYWRLWAIEMKIFETKEGA
jgi:L-alanine-DL-glutamate epimerase-like enolase superfamily enzyme